MEGGDCECPNAEFAEEKRPNSRVSLKKESAICAARK